MIYFCLWKLKEKVKHKSIIIFYECLNLELEQNSLK